MIPGRFSINKVSNYGSRVKSSRHMIESRKLDSFSTLKILITSNVSPLKEAVAF